MKNVILVVFAFAVGFGCAYWYVTKADQDRLATLQQAATKAQANVSANPEVDSPDAILQKLAVLNPNAATSHPRAARRIIFYLESLVNAGDSAVQPISSFIATGRDMNYVLEGVNVNDLGYWNWRPGRPIYSGMVLPATLRLSLVDVLRDIGTPGAVQALVAMLQNSTRAVEVAYIGGVLEKLAPGQYAALADAMAKKALAEAPGTNTTALDSGSKSYLYRMLSSHGDTSMVAVAESTLATPGPLDRDAAEFLINTLKQDAIPMLAKIYPGASYADQNAIANLTFNYVGLSPDADNIFQEWVMNNTAAARDESVNGRARALALSLLGGGSYGPFTAPAPTDPSEIADRLALLDKLQSQLADPRLQQAITQAKKNLGGN
jgi:hypothetical protein